MAARQHLLFPAAQSPSQLSFPIFQNRKKLIDLSQIGNNFPHVPAHIGTHLQVIYHRHRREKRPAFCILCLR